MIIVLWKDLARFAKKYIDARRAILIFEEC